LKLCHHRAGKSVNELVVAEWSKVKNWAYVGTVTAYSLEAYFWRDIRLALAYYSSHRWRYQLKGPLRHWIAYCSNSNKVREDIIAVVDVDSSVITPKRSINLLLVLAWND
jgi:hypothetical protein